MEKSKGSVFIGVLNILFISVFSFGELKAQCVNTFPYVEDFETVPAWTAVSVPNATCTTADWTWGTPNHTYAIQSAGSGTKCWNVGGLTGAFYKFWEQGYVVSPCFNFTNLQYPHIKFKLFYECEYHFDGGNLQYSLNGGTTWIDVGTCGGTNASPVPEPNDCNTHNWYNYPGINYLNNPPGFVTSKHGWSGNTQAGGVGWDPSNPGVNCVGGNGQGHWLTAEHCLTGCGGQPNVLLRFTFGAGYSCNDFDGLSFDSVAVSNGISNSATFTHICASANTVNFAATPNACPTNTYAWNFGDVASGAANTSASQNSSHTFSGPGSYTVTLIASGGACNPPDTIKQVVNIMTATVTTFTNVSCNGANNGAATVTTTSALNPVTYTWSPSGGNAATASGLSPGTYTVSVSDAGSCPVKATVNITQPTPIVVTPTQTNVLCNGASNGSASVNVTGGTPAYTYSWTPSGGTTSAAAGLSAGNYSVTVTDANNCHVIQSINITQPTALVLTASTTSASCAGNNGTASATVSGGTGPYTYTWTPVGGNSANATGLAGGNYTISISDANGCTKNATVNVAQSISFTISVTSTSVSCNGGTNGTASANVTGGTGPFTYSWSPTGGTTSNASNLPSGNYSVSVTDGSGCSGSASISVSQPTPLLVTPTSTNVLCNGVSNGSASVSVSGGTPGYTYSWSPSGGTSSSATGLSAGNYSVTVTDANNCHIIQNFNITQPTALSVSVITTSTSCAGNNGTATATVTGGTGPYTYTWSPAGGNSANATALSGGSYTVNVTDAHGCVINSAAFVTQPVSFSVTVTSTSVSCNGGTNGTASANVTGGTGPFTYSWSPTGGTTNNASNLPAGNYSVTVTDPSGCSGITPVTIAQPVVLSPTVTSVNVLCNGGNSGSATATVSGGTGPYTYSWSPSGGNAATASVLSAGNYTVNITDANGCIKTSSIVITQPSALTVSTATTSVSCNGGNNGSAAATANGGTMPYTYSWSPGGSTSSIVNNLSAGNYTVTVTDAHGCTQIAAAIISQPPSTTITITNTPAFCGASNGTASAAVSGGVSPYTYSWLPAGGITANASGLSAGNYTLTVTDANNCSNTATTLIASTSGVNVSATTTSVTCNGGNNGTATATANGGTAPYNYTWSSGAATSTASGLSAGIYTVTATDINGCTHSATITINQPTPVTVVTSGTTICNGQTATLSANASGGTSPYTYSWNGGTAQASNTTTVSPVSASTYTVIAFDNNGCPSIGSIATVNVLPLLQITTGDAVICAGSNANLNAIASGGNGNYTYTWMPGNIHGNSINVTPQNTTVYTVTVSDGCTTTNATDTGLVTIITVPVLALPPNIAGCAPQCMSFTVANNPNITSWQWNLGDNTTSSVQNPFHCYNKPGSYNVSLTYTTSQGCVNSVSQNGLVTVYAQPEADFSASAYETDVYNMQILFTNQSTGAVNWQWNFGDLYTSVLTSPSHTYGAIGIYDILLIATNQFGCKDSIIKEIKIHEDFTFYAPNAFSPNSDGTNEKFLPEGTGWDLNTYNLWVFDRWGNQVFYTSDANKGWNGTYKSDDIVQQDVYVWKVKLNDIFGMNHEYKGTVSVVK
ncbi:MAG TPA: PKD domain-containing protein [Bacteroidia bacterium]|jgi:gliding motility-associated-like protein|nr:PKD domain-containing protein [Bacteroidia bacterium]